MNIDVPMRRSNKIGYREALVVYGGTLSVNLVASHFEGKEVVLHRYCRRPIWNESGRRALIMASKDESGVDWVE